MSEKFLKFIIDRKNENEESTHIINVSSAISYFPTLIDNIIYSFDNFYKDKETINFFEEKCINDGELRNLLVCSLLYAEKYEKETLIMILEKYLQGKKYDTEVKSTTPKDCNKDDFMIANLLLFDYYMYLKTGIYDGLVTNI